jgi:hypothetical protein
MTRPVGPVKIAATDVRNRDVMTARLSGAVRAEAAAVRHKGEYYFVAPERLGGTRKVPADSLTDCMNYSVWELNEEMKRAKKKKKEAGR